MERIFASRIVKTAALVQFGGMFRLLYALGALLISWGAYVLVTGDFVATQDIAAGLVGSGVGVIALGAVVASLDRIAQQLNQSPVSAGLPSQPLAEASPPPRATGPTLVREGVVEGRRYRFYSDGSIEAEGPHGLRRYRSMEDAREDILRGRDEESSRRTDQPEGQRTTPAANRPGRPGRAWENHLLDREEDRGHDRYAPQPREADAAYIQNAMTNKRRRARHPD